MTAFPSFFLSSQSYLFSPYFDHHKFFKNIIPHDLIFNKENDAEDAITAITYLKRKEENAEGKSVFVEYVTNISNI